MPSSKKVNTHYIQKPENRIKIPVFQSVRAVAFYWTRFGLLSKQQTFSLFVSSQDPFCILLFNWDSQETLSKVSAKHASPIKQHKLSPVTNYPALAQQSRRSLSGLQFPLLHYKCAAAVLSLILGYCADGSWRLVDDLQQQQETSLICSSYANNFRHIVKN